MRSVLSAVAAAGLSCLIATGAQAAVLIYCTPGAPEGYDPALHILPGTFEASSQTVYDRLVTRVPGSAVIVPALAESWEVSKDGQQYVFHLRQGVKFHTTPYFTPSRDLNADDVVFSLERQFNPKLSYFSYGGSWPYYNAMGLPELVKSVDKVDGATVRIRLNRPDAGFLADLAMDFASIVSREYADSLLKVETPELLDKRPIGTGPFQFVTDSPQQINFKANADYWGGAPQFYDLVFRFVADPKERFDRLQAGDCDVIADPEAAAVKVAESDPALKIEKTDAADLVYLAINTSKKPFDDPRVRKALSLAIDRSAIVDSIYGGLAAPAAAILPPVLQGYSAGSASVRDRDAAKALLQEAGASDLKLTILTGADARPNNPAPQRMARMIAADLNLAGVNATVETAAPLGEFLRQSVDKARDSAVLFGWSGGNGDSADFLSMMLSCKAVGASNRAEWCDKDFSALLDQAMTESDASARAALLGQAVSMTASAMPLIPIVHTEVAVPMKKSVSGISADPFGLLNFAHATVAN